MADKREAPKPGTAEFRALIEKHKDFEESLDGVRPEFILDVGAGDMQGQEPPAGADGQEKNG